MDFETTSHDPKLTSLDPFGTCWIAGVALLDESGAPFYIPVDHQEPYGRFNVPRDEVIDWLREVMDYSHTWINHNVKYDAHCAINDFGIKFEGDYVCTLVRAKIFNTDLMFQGGYGLDAMAKRYLDWDIREHEQALKPYLVKNKDYGRIDPRVMAPYAKTDVLAVKEFDEFLWKNVSPELFRTMWTETSITKVLIDIEQTGMRVDPTKVREETIHAHVRMLTTECYMQDKYGKLFNFASPKDMRALFEGVFRLPILAWTEDEDGERLNPSYAKGILKEYANMKDAPKEDIEKVIQWKKDATYTGLFLNTYKKKADERGILHPSYGQILKTGRMSCSGPNMQQLSEWAKVLIEPLEPGDEIWSYDYSQIEFRTITHYINDRNAIEQYLKDPDSDFHDLVSQFCKVPRKPAKTLNFQTAFGGGKKKMIETLSTYQEIHDMVAKELENYDPEIREKLYKNTLDKHALNCYNTYHATFPTLKSTAKACQGVCERVGYVRTLMGRRRHFSDKKFSYAAFNAVNQGTAADIMKEKMYHLSEYIKPYGIKLIGVVHDEAVFNVPAHLAGREDIMVGIANLMETPTVEMKVPIRVNFGRSSVNWADAGRVKLKVVDNKVVEVKA